MALGRALAVALQLYHWPCWGPLLGQAGDCKGQRQVLREAQAS